MSSRILIVDDEEAVRRNFRALLEDAGHTVYDGHEVRASVETTIRRGEIVYADGRVVGRAGTSRVLARGKTQAP